MKTRDVARTVLLNEQNEVFLFQYEDPVVADPEKPNLTIYWATPGGGVEAGETFEQAALRELWEETGITDAQLGPCIWTRSRPLQVRGEMMRFDERYFLVHTTTTQITLDHSCDWERQVTRDYRWWTVAELEQSSDHFMPASFIERVKEVILGHIPATPLDVSE